MKKSKRSSELLMEIAQDKPLAGDLTYQHFLQRLGDRAFGIVLLFFALPSALPSSFLPGISLIFSLPIAIFALQIIFARKTLWLPNVIGKRKISHEKISKIIHAAVPYLAKIERFLKPRWDLMMMPVMEIIHGIAIFFLALLLILPIPFSNFILATLVIIFSLGFAEKDGVFIVIGYIGSILYVSFIYLLIIATIKTVLSGHGV
ncbi:exopolysaccharide biosynthesis protein [Aquicella lusitana]|uniref:Exopolysaccharide synthesis protein ExoD n=1 Tax=Aquicella lusitana TaxID=254246 RepID=A0A370GVC5_9COXI|nr:exopolysaccharide biosynthesis protein [Aquicella lusitana]RDI46524.1 hypothetical protein C8D86_10548 [Aquicella lusitana]VVC74188.1 hypothetical protein AQULUS_19530 [Aquicella lusitana]